MSFNMRDQITTQSQEEHKREQQINLQIQALHNQIGHKLFTIEVVSAIRHQLLNPTNPNTIDTEILNRYINSLGEETKQDLSHELQIFHSVGQLSSYFVRGQELDSSAIDEMLQLVKEWTNASQRISGVSSPNKEALRSSLLGRFDRFRMSRRIEVWTQWNLKDFRCVLEGSNRNSADAAKTGALSAGVAFRRREISGKRKLSFEADEFPESKRAREFNDLYDASPKRKQHQRAAVETEVDETSTMDQS